MHKEKYLTTLKNVGETPLMALERLRIRENIPKATPLAYAGRLDPMASGQLLILVGDECKSQECYHTLDKEYVFEVLLGVGSDTHDVLGIVSQGAALAPTLTQVKRVLKELVGSITLPYPHFSSKTVGGKPLHTWTLEGRLGEIEVPKKTSTIYSLSLLDIRTIDAAHIKSTVLAKIDSIPPVTDPKKALGEDFRRVDVKASWDALFEGAPSTRYTVLTLTCICSSGTYMRTLASVIGERLGTKALAYSIHRSRIGKYFDIRGLFGFWLKTYAKD
jgi:tRNA pseudouridine(55) synthase